MDKRYILIIGIVSICLFNLYILADYSDIVGSASVDYKNVTFTLPKDFNLLETTNNRVQIHNPNFGYITLTYHDDDSKINFQNYFSNIANNSKYIILSNGTINIENIKVDSVYYQSRLSDGSLNNHSSFLFVKDNTTYEINMANFDYNDRNSTINNLEIIINSLRPNYKN